jgi:hypothetical protein
MVRSQHAAAFAGWNILDGAVVLLGWVDIALSGDDYIFLRTVRVLRPLRTITHIRGLKVRCQFPISTQLPAFIAQLQMHPTGADQEQDLAVHAIFLGQLP